MQRLVSLNQAMRWLFLSVLVVAPMISTVHAAPDTSCSSVETEYAHAQKMRSEARELAGDGTDKTKLHQAADKLESALVYLAQPDVYAKSTGNLSLYSRGHDVRYDLASIYMQLGMKDKAMTELEAMQKFVWVPPLGELILKDPILTQLKDEPRFQAVIANARLPDHLWNVPSIATPFKPTLSIEERVAGLSLFWAEARQNFVYFDHVPTLEWDKLYMEYLTKVMETEKTSDYYNVMIQIAAQLHDGHTNIYPPQELIDSFYSKPPMTTAMIEDKVLVLSVESDSLAKLVKTGDEIISIDGIDVQRYAEEKIAPYVSSSTSQDRRLRMFGYQLLDGDANQPLTLRMRDSMGKEYSATVKRSGYTDIQTPEIFTFKMLPNDVAYFALDHFESDESIKAFERALPQIMKAKSLIIDMRQNGGGSSDYGYDILSYLSDKPIYTETSYQRSEDAVLRARLGAFVKWAPLTGNSQPFQSPKHEHIFTGKVEVLTSAQTYSAGEDFVVAFQTMKRGKTIGEPTGGSTGQPLLFALPGGGKARICVKRDLFPDGREFVGKGIQPDISVAPTVSGIRSARDTVLEHALELLRD